MSFHTLHTFVETVEHPDAGVFRIVTDDGRFYIALADVLNPVDHAWSSSEVTQKFKSDPDMHLIIAWNPKIEDHDIIPCVTLETAGRILQEDQPEYYKHVLGFIFQHVAEKAHKFFLRQGIDKGYIPRQ